MRSACSRENCIQKAVALPRERPEGIGWRLCGEFSATRGPGRGELPPPVATGSAGGKETGRGPWREVRVQRSGGGRRRKRFWGEESSA